MKIFKNVSRFTGVPGGVLTIGNFDGLHLGHRRIIADLRRRADKRGAPAVVMTFTPHTQAVLSVGSAYSVLTTPAEKKGILEGLGIDHLIFLRFNHSLLKMPAADFLKKIVFKHIRPGEILLGHDHRFGKGRAGNFTLLKSLCRRRGVAVRRVPPVRVDEKVVSSTLIRELISLGKVTEAGRLLGGPYPVHGRVERGDRRGRRLGFPTANLSFPSEKRLPPDGVYYGEIRSGRLRARAVISLGEQPTFAGKKRVLEAHLIDFKGDLYGKALTLFFKGFIRRQRKFNSVQTLIQRIRRDIAYAKNALKKEETSASYD